MPDDRAPDTEFPCWCGFFCADYVCDEHSNDEPCVCGTEFTCMASAHSDGQGGAE